MGVVVLTRRLYRITHYSMFYHLLLKEIQQRRHYFFQICCPKGTISPPLDTEKSICEGDAIDKYYYYEYDESDEALEALDALGCVPPKSKESKGEFPYFTEEKCLDYPGTKCKLGNQCGAKGNTRFLKIFRDVGVTSGFQNLLRTSIYGMGIIPSD